MTKRKVTVATVVQSPLVVRDGWPDSYPGLPPDVEAQIQAAAPAALVFMQEAAQRYRNAVAERNKALAASQQARLGLEFVAQLKAAADVLTRVDVGQLEPVAYMEAARRGFDLIESKEATARGLKGIAAVYETVSVPSLLPTPTKPPQKPRDDFAATIVRLVGPHCPKSYMLQSIVFDALNAVGAGVPEDLPSYLRRVKKRIKDEDTRRQEAREILAQTSENSSPV